jgi:hypothetical protein
MELRELFRWHVSLVVATGANTRIDRLRRVEARVGLSEFDLSEGSITTYLTNFVFNDEDSATHLILVQVRVGH